MTTIIHKKGFLLIGTRSEIRQTLTKWVHHHPLVIDQISHQQHLISTKKSALPVEK